MSRYDLCESCGGQITDEGKCRCTDYTKLKAPVIKIDAIGDTAYTHGCRAMVSPRHKGTGLTDVCLHCGRSA